jgi:DNA repair exonuclease SbcCD ATPase subunit
VRRIIFTEIGMENYGPYTEPFILECPENSLTLITGPNGVGKTISLDAMSFTFYGITSKGERGDDVVNNIVEKNCRTWVKFKEDGGDSYLVERYHKHTKYRNTVHITRNNDDKPYKVGHKECLPEIERLICDRKAFTNTLMFGQKVKDFFTDLTDTDQKAIFWKILDLLKYGHFSKTASKELDTLGAQIRDILTKIDIANGVITNIEEQILTEIQKSKTYEIDKKTKSQGLQEVILSTKEMLKLSEDTLATLPINSINDVREKVFQLKTEMEKIAGDAGNIKTTITAEANIKVNELTAAKTEKLKEIAVIYQNLSIEVTDKKRALIDTFTESIRLITQDESVLNVEKAGEAAHISSTDDRIKELEETDLAVGSECPTCLGTIEGKALDHIAHIIKDLQDNVKIRKNNVKLLDTKSNKLSLKKKKLGDKQTIELSHISTEIEELSTKKAAELKEAEDRLISVKQQIAEMANKNLRAGIKDLEEKAKEKQIEYNAAETELRLEEEKERKKTEMEAKITKYKMTITNLEDQDRVLLEKEFDDTTLKQSKTNKQKQLKIIVDSNKKTEKVNEEIKRLEFWKEAFSKSGIPSMLIDDAVPIMNKSMKKYLDLLSNGRYIVTFDTQSQTKTGEYRDKFAVNVLDTKTRVHNRKQLSGGQTRLIDVATILTLRDLKMELGGVEFNLFAFDEIFDALDDSNIGYVCGIMNSLKSNRSLLIVSHRHQDQLEADRHIQLT